ncbi:MAG: hypothetical protein IJ222_03265 [Bacteroidales bacterium]|nr:hypothetical protein [Bacteroidales bacterium]
MAGSYWGAYNPPFGKHPGIPLDEYCVPEDAHMVSCDMQDFTCKDTPVFDFEKASPLERDDIEEKDEGTFLRPEQIVPFLKFLQQNKKRYFPPDGSKKWNFCPYKNLRFSRVSKNHFVIFGAVHLFPLNWKIIMNDTRYGQDKATSG